MPELDQPTLNRICEHYGIRPLRAAERCAKCGGRGSIPSLALGGIRCPNCDRGVVDRGMLKDAIMDWYTDRGFTTQELITMLTEAGQGPALGIGTSHRLWAGRHNQPWQSSLEHWVLSYREDWTPTDGDILQLLVRVAKQVGRPVTTERCETAEDVRRVVLAAAAATLPEGE